MKWPWSKKHSHSFWDQIGISVSTICLIHCLVLPFVVIGLPWLAAYLHTPFFHVIIFFLVVPIGVYAFLQGYRHHKKVFVLALGITGLLIVGLGTFLSPDSHEEEIHHEADADADASPHIPTVIGSVLLVTAHYFNRRSCSNKKHRH